MLFGKLCIKWSLAWITVVKDGQCVLAVVYTKLLEMKGEIVYSHLSAVFILTITEQVLIKPDICSSTVSLSSQFSTVRYSNYFVLS